MRLVGHTREQREATTSTFSDESRSLCVECATELVVVVLVIASNSISKNVPEFIFLR